MIANSWLHAEFKAESALQAQRLMVDQLKRYPKAEFDTNASAFPIENEGLCVGYWVWFIRRATIEELREWSMPIECGGVFYYELI